MSSSTETRTAIIHADGHQTDLLIVPPDTSEQAVRAAMGRAAQAGRRSRALAGLTVGPGPS